ncbi:tonB-system energizer ExbB [Insolitispirillum peregrinum]|uniref:tonB-system energizer ExbB n=1 Tax=Insolitispirillum peregrinum TaxID=80876 RepID=UPI001FE6A59F|nr:tonB-system energizer ExbB [Insolitispirillum peregrinum]
MAATLPLSAFAQEIAPSSAPAPVLPHDLSPWSMFMAADVVVKSVMIGLALASLATWTVFLVKVFELRSARGRIRGLIDLLQDCRSLADAGQAVHGAKKVESGPIDVAILEARLSAGVPGEGLKERVASRLHRLEARANHRLIKGTGILASIGSTSPFIGLFGTVWGIMNSFIGISQAQTTNLAVVAPGIAEALLATALGLVAAIPAVLIYNAFSRSMGGYRALLSDVSAEVLRLVSRDLDRQALPLRAAAE